MNCPVCTSELTELKDCSNCGYTEKITERVGSIMEYNGQRMTSQASLILAVVIGIFSLSTITPTAISGNLSIIQSLFSVVVFCTLWLVGIYLIYRFESTRYYCTVLESIERWPSKFLESWKNKRKEKEYENVDFGAFLYLYTQIIKKDIEKRYKSKNFLIKCAYYVFATRLTYLFYSLFVFILAFLIYSPIIGALFI